MIVAVKAKAPAGIALRWSDGTRVEIDIAHIVRGRALRDTDEFSRAEIGEWGHSIVWPSGAELSAEALGLSRRMVAYYSNGEKPVPRPILLACKGWEVEHAA